MDPITPQPQEQSYSSVPEPKHFLNKKFIVTFVVLALLGGGAYAGIWYWGNQQVVEEVAPTFTPRVIDETVGWKTYTNTLYGFEFKYPTGWHTEICADGASYLGVYLGDASKLVLCESDAPSYGYVSIVVGKITPNVTINKYVNDTKNGMDNPVEKNIIIDGLQATRIQGKTRSVEGPGPEAGLKTVVVYLQSDDNLYRFIYIDVNRKDESVAFDQILSTFKLTDSADTSTWKTLRGSAEYQPEYTVSIKYPPTWIGKCERFECYVTNKIPEGIMQQNLNLCYLSIKYPYEGSDWQIYELNTFNGSAEKTSCQNTLNQIRGSIIK